MAPLPGLFRRLAAAAFLFGLGVSVAVATDTSPAPPVPPSPPPLPAEPADSGVVEDLSPTPPPLPPMRPGGPGGLPGGPPGRTGGARTADGVDDFGACRDEGRRLCAEVYQPGYVPRASWKLDLVRCLGEHRTDLTPDCQASLDRRAQLNTQVNTACARDRGRLCPGVRPQPGSEAGNACLREHLAEVTPECRVALEAHEAAKPQRAR